MEFKHISVLLEESIDSLNIKEDGIYVDGTLGGGGHSEEILKRLSKKGKLISIDQDEDAIRHSSERLKKYENSIIVKNNFSNIKNILEDLNIEKVDGVLLDLGVSSYQLDNAKRGFSYNKDSEIDMRMDLSNDIDGKKVVNNYSEEELTSIFFEYGEEKFSKRIAKKIVESREIKEIESTLELSEIVKSVIPKSSYSYGDNPEKRVFQAIRIEVNAELKILKKAIEDIIDVTKKGGRVSIITFHSLEDRIVKETFKEKAIDCICPKAFPICVCNNKSKIKIITKKPIIPSKEELDENRRSHSSKLRVCEIK